MMPVVAHVKDALAGRAQVVQLDIDENKEAADAAGVQSIPTFLVYKDGELKWRESGEMEGTALLAAVEKYL